MKLRGACKFLLLLFLVLIPTNVLGKEVAQTCKYQTDISSGYLLITCDYYSDSSKPSCKIYSTEVNENSEGFENWTKETSEWYETNNKCFPYLVYVDKDALINRYELYVFDELSKANQFVNNQHKYYEKVYVVGLDSVDRTIHEEIESYIEMLSDIGTYFELDNFCKISNGKYVLNGGELCASALGNLIDSINKWDANIKDWVKRNKISGNDPIIKEYEDARKNARSKISSAWDGEIEDPSDTPIRDILEPEIPDEDTTASRICVSCGGGSVDGIPKLLPIFVRNMIWLVQIITPIILIGLGMYDFIKAVISSDEKVMKESQNRFIKRIIAALLIFLIVAIVKFAFNLIPGDSTFGCVSCFISDADKCGEEYVCKRADETSE